MSIENPCDFLDPVPCGVNPSFVYTRYPCDFDDPRPGDSYGLPVIIDLQTPVKAEVINRHRESILAIEAELGIQPSGTYTTVRARLDALEATLCHIWNSLSDGYSVNVSYNGELVVGNVQNINFVGSSVSVTNEGDNQANITITAGTGKDVDVYDENTLVKTAIGSLKFTGNGVVATSGPDDQAIITINGDGYSISVYDENILRQTAINKLNFMGAGVVATAGASGEAIITVNGDGYSISVYDENILRQTAINKLNFIGAGVVATAGASGEAIITINGDGYSLDVYDEGILRQTAIDKLNFVGAGVVATAGASGEAIITVTDYSIDVYDESVLVKTSIGSLKFVGDGVVATAGPDDQAIITINNTSSGTILTVYDENILRQSTVSKLNFMGDGVVATAGASGEAIITISSGSGGDGYSIDVYDEGELVKTSIEKLNFVGDGVVATAGGEGEVIVTITGGNTVMRQDVFNPVPGQTEFVLQYLPIDQDSTELFISGLSQTVATDYTVSGQTVTYSGNPPINGAEEVVVKYFQDISLTIVPNPAEMRQDVFTASVGQTVFELEDSPISDISVELFIDGISQTVGADYSVSLNVLQYMGVPALEGGEVVVIKYFTAIVDAFNISHALKHEAGGVDPIDGTKVSFSYTPTNYSPPASNILGAHIAAIDAAMLGAGVGISAGTNLRNSGTVTFSNSNGISFGMNSLGAITASTTQAAQTTVGFSAGTNSRNSGTVSFTNSNGVSFGMNTAGLITASVVAPTTYPVVTFSAGTTSVSSGSIKFSNSNGISFGMDTAGVVTASTTQAAQTTVGISAGTNSRNSGVVTFASASNNVSCGMDANGSVTWSVAAIPAATTVGISAGTNSRNAGTVSFTNSNGVSFGMNTDGLITASVTTYPVVTFSAGTTSVSSGSIKFSNSNGISFGMDTAGVVTASTTQAAQTTVGFSAGTNSRNSGTVTFSNSNGVSFGMNTAGVVTASVAATSAPPGKAVLITPDLKPFASTTALSLQGVNLASQPFQGVPFSVPNIVSLASILFPFGVSEGTAVVTATNSLSRSVSGHQTISYGFYSLTGQTYTTVASGSIVASLSASGTSRSLSLGVSIGVMSTSMSGTLPQSFTGQLALNFAQGTITLNPGMYLFATLGNVSTTSSEGGLVANPVFQMEQIRGGSIYFGESTPVWQVGDNATTVSDSGIVRAGIFPIKGATSTALPASLDLSSATITTIGPWFIAI